MRRHELMAAAQLALRPLRAHAAPVGEKPLSGGALGAVAAGMLLAVALLAATESRAPAGGGSDNHAAMRAAGSTPLLADATLALDEVSTAHITAEEPKESAETRWFNNRPIRPVKTINMLVTAYSPDEQSCGIWADGITASGYSVWTNGMKLVAADTSILPFGSLVSIPGYDSGHVVPVLDRGGAIKGHRLDVLYPTHERALEWGVQRLEVTIWEYDDDEPNGFRQDHRPR